MPRISPVKVSGKMEVQMPLDLIDERARLIARGAIQCFAHCAPLSLTAADFWKWVAQIEFIVKPPDFLHLARFGAATSPLGPQH